MKESSSESCFHCLKSRTNTNIVSPLADAAPALPERPAEKRLAPTSPRPETAQAQTLKDPVQTLKDFSHLLRPENFHPLTSHVHMLLKTSFFD